MCKKTKPNEVQVVMTGHSISVVDRNGRFLRTWEVNKKFKHDFIIDWLEIEELVPSDVSYIVFPWLEVLRK